MDLKQIEKLMISMGRNGIRRFAIKREGFELELERDCKNVHSISQSSLGNETVFSGFSQEGSLPSVASLPSQEKKEDKIIEGKFIESPMVGTFYLASSPESPPYIKVGDLVTEETVVCIIEAMKVMNEVKAGVKGIIKEVVLTNGDPVQFGTRLFRIEETL